MCVNSRVAFSRATPNTLKLHFTGAVSFSLCFLLFILLVNLLLSLGLLLVRGWFLHLLRLETVRFVGCGSLVSQQIFLLLLILHVETLHDLICTALVSCLQEHAHVHGELDCVSRRSRPEVVLARFKAIFPGMEVHHRHLVELGVLLVQVQRL